MSYEVFKELDRNKSYNVISIVSEQSAVPNILFIKALEENNIKIEKCIFLYTQKHKPKQTEILKEYYNRDNCYLVKPYNLKNIKEENIKEIAGECKDFIFNITGGTKIMSCALFDFAKEKNMLDKVFYVYNNKIYKINQPESSLITNGLLDAEKYFKILQDSNRNFDIIKYNDEEIKEKFIQQIRNDNEKRVCFTYNNKLYLIYYDKDFSKHENLRGRDREEYIKPATHIGHIVYNINLIKKKTGPFSKAIIITEENNYNSLTSNQKDLIKLRIESSEIELIINNENTNLYEEIKNIVEEEQKENQNSSVTANNYSYKPNIIVSLVGEQSIPNILFIKHIMKTKNVNKNDCSFLFIYTKKTESIKERIINFFNNETNNNFYDLEITNSTEFTKIRENISTEIEKIKNISAQKPNFFFNITGGTKPMSCALFDLAEGQNVYYIDGNNVYSIDSESNEAENIYDNLLNIEEYFKAVLPKNQHFECNEYNIDNDRKKIFELIFKFKKENNPRCPGANPKNKKHFEDFIKRINITDLNLSNFCYNDKFFKDKWLEQHVYFNIMNKLSKEKTKLNAKLKIEQDVFRDTDFNEIDVCFINKNILYIVECKANISGSNEIIQDEIDVIINKLKYIQIKTGLLAKATLIVAEERVGKFNKYIKDEANKNGIQLIMPLKEYSDDLYTRIYNYHSKQQ